MYKSAHVCRIYVRNQYMYSIYSWMYKRARKVLSSPILACLRTDGLFILMTNWSNVACGAVLCQTNPGHPDTPTLVQAIMRDEKCLFDLSKSRPHLCPISFISPSLLSPLVDTHFEQCDPQGVKAKHANNNGDWVWWLVCSTTWAPIWLSYA